MTDEELVSCLEALLFANGKPVSKKLLVSIMEIDESKIKEIAEKLSAILKERNSGIQLIEIEDGYQLATVEKYYEKVCSLLDNRPKPSISQAGMEVLAIIAYNPKITRAEIEKIRGVSSDTAINKLMEYGLIEEAGRLDTIGRPMTFKTSDEFLRLFGYVSLKDMPELPPLVEDDGQIEIDDLPKKEEDDELSKLKNDETLDE
jgi:segregation and condensation protein B